MFAVIYLFEVKPDQDSQFIDAWEEMTTLIYNHAGSLGSRLHKKDECTYIAYAQWPNRKTWLNSKNKLPDTARLIGDKMRESCLKIETLHELECEIDLLKLSSK